MRCSRRAPSRFSSAWCSTSRSRWSGPSPVLGSSQRRLGQALDPKTIAELDPDALATAFSARPALHRYPGSMAGRVQELAKLVVERYSGRTDEIWASARLG